MIRLLLFLVMLFPVFASAQNAVDSLGRKQGRWEKRFEDGKLKYEGTFKDDKPVGVFKYYYPKTGELNISQDYKSPVVAHCQMFHKNGQVMAKGIYNNQKKDSTWKYFNEKGQLISEERYIKGVKNGIWKTYYDSGSVAEEITFVNDLEHGPIVEYFKNGQVKLKGGYKKGKMEGLFAGFYPNGNKSFEGTYANDLKEGTWIFYNEKGIPEKKISYNKGKQVNEVFLNGVLKSYYDNKKPMAEITYENGKKTGPFKEFYDNGEWIKVPVTQEEMPGNNNEMKEVLEGQTLKVKGHYLNDKYHGKITWYKPNGQVEKVEEYINGEKVTAKQ